MDPLLGSLSLPLLARAALPPNYRELRLSRGFGMILGAPNPLIRITAGPGGVAGDVILYHAVLSTTDSQPRVRWAAEIVRSRHRIDWRRALVLLDSLGVGILVSPHYPMTVSDAGDLVVEVRGGSSYRKYELNAPGRRSDPLGIRAARIARIVDSLVADSQ